MRKKLAIPAGGFHFIGREYTVLIITTLLVLLTPVSSALAQHEPDTLVRHNVTIVRTGDIPCGDDPTPANDYTITRTFTVIVDHQDENGQEHVITHVSGTYSAVPFDSALPTYEGRTILTDSTQLIPNPEGRTDVVRTVSRILVTGSDGSKINFLSIGKFQIINGEITLSEVDQQCLSPS